eukprot:COSAG03_NODE_7322_length_934_cov_2.558084_2_plen_97_part_00
MCVCVCVCVCVCLNHVLVGAGILGMMNLLGWELGVIESVSITVLVGLSVDYVVHLANSYVEADVDKIKLCPTRNFLAGSLLGFPTMSRRVHVFFAD